MPNTTENAKYEIFPLIPLRGLVAFPGVPMNIELTDKKLTAACRKANETGVSVFLVTTKNPGDPSDADENLYRVGTVAKIKQFVALPDGNGRIFADCACRGILLKTGENTDGSKIGQVLCKTISVEQDERTKKALARAIRTQLRELTKFIPNLSESFLLAADSIETPGLLADFAASNVLIRFDDKQKVLEEFDPNERVKVLCALMESEREILEEEFRIHKEVRERLDENQRDYYLREQIKVIRNELGEGEEEDDEIVEYRRRIREAKLPEEVEEHLTKEVGKLAKTPYSSAESTVIRNYLDTCLDIPWTSRSEEHLDLAEAKKILDDDHDGLTQVKERVLEFLATRVLNPGLKNQILCLVGPPGTGKTSIASSIARAMRRAYVRVSLGGIRDEADIRGHRKTYVAAMPGRVVTALLQAKTMNPVILLDEIDKMTKDSHGDPTSAMLEVLDSEQNKAFRDHFVEIPVDLSDCFFIATANNIENVPRPLLDRMEVIELKIYTRHEKLSIAKHHLIPKQTSRHGLSKKAFRISDKALFEIIDYYTCEAGVRNLERTIASLCRKAAKEIVETGCAGVSFTPKNLEKYLGPSKVTPDRVYEKDEVGTVNGLAYTELGGDMLRVEASSMPGTGQIRMTGSLGDVMKESAMIAVSYIRAHAAQLGIDPEFYKNRDLHIHVPEGAVPKDGPSAGVTLVTAIASELSGVPVRRDIAMTGEVTLHGRVLPIGGLKEKTMAAYKAGITDVCIPKDNVKDMTELDPVVRGSLRFIPCSQVSEVLDAAMVRA